NEESLALDPKTIRMKSVTGRRHWEAVAALLQTRPLPLALPLSPVMECRVDRRLPKAPPGSQPEVAFRRQAPRSQPEVTFRRPAPRSQPKVAFRRPAPRRLLPVALRSNRAMSHLSASTKLGI